MTLLGIGAHYAISRIAVMINFSITTTDIVVSLGQILMPNGHFFTTSLQHGNHEVFINIILRLYLLPKVIIWDFDVVPGLSSISHQTEISLSNIYELYRDNVNNGTIHWTL